MKRVLNYRSLFIIGVLTVSMLTGTARSAYYWFQNDQWENGDEANQAQGLEFCTGFFSGDYACATFEIDQDCVIDKIGVLLYGINQSSLFWIHAYEGDSSSSEPGMRIPPYPIPEPLAQYSVSQSGFIIFDLNDPEVQGSIPRSAGDKLVICIEYLGTLSTYPSLDVCTDTNGIDPNRNFIRKCPGHAGWETAEEFGYKNNFIIRAGWEIPDPTATPQPSNTPTSTPTVTSTPVPTDTPTPSPTAPPSSTPTNTPTSTFTPTNTPTATNTPTSTPTTPPLTPTYTPLPTFTPTPAPTSTPSLTPTPTHSPSPTFTPTVLPTETPTVTWTATNTPTATPTATPTYEPYRLPFFDPFEEELPWTIDPLYGDCLWHRETARYTSEFHSWAYNRGDPEYNYNTGQRNSCSLVSPLISLANTTYPVLRFWDWIQNEERELFDVCRVEISSDNGQTWNILMETYEKTEAWIERGPIDLRSYVGNLVKIRFRFDSLDSQFNDFEGWYIDDVSVMEYVTPTPTQTPEPTITPTATPTTSGVHGLNLILNDTVFVEGETFHLEMELGNTTGTSLIGDTYILLDVYGSYWYWPSWDTELDFRENDSLPPGYYSRETILQFEWPPYDGSFDGVYIWGAIFHAGTTDFIGEVDFVVFGSNV